MLGQDDENLSQFRSQKKLLLTLGTITILYYIGEVKLAPESTILDIFSITHPQNIEYFLWFLGLYFFWRFHTISHDLRLYNNIQSIFINDFATSEFKVNHEQYKKNLVKAGLDPTSNKGITRTIDNDKKIISLISSSYITFDNIEEKIYKLKKFDVFCLKIKIAFLLILNKSIFNDFIIPYLWSIFTILIIVSSKIN